MQVKDFNNGTAIVLSKVVKVGPVYDSNSSPSRFEFFIYLEGEHSLMVSASNHAAVVEERVALLREIRML